MKLLSFFTGAGGLDLGFEKAGFEIIYANEFDKKIWDTYKYNHKNTELDTRSITNIDPESLPDCDGIIGGPPCQSWSEAGSKKGLLDPRGQLFFNFIRIVEVKQPRFFLAENVPGLLADRNADALAKIMKEFKKCGYNLHYKVLNAKDFGSAQDRKRVIFIGVRKDIDKTIADLYPEPYPSNKVLSDVIFDLKDNAVPALNITKPANTHVDNHEYITSTFSSMFMSRNRVRLWNEPSFTIQAGGRHAPLHPDSEKMIWHSTDKFLFANPDKVRRLTVRECARIQGFPDDFKFIYKDVMDGYKMVGNAVSVDFAYAMAKHLISRI